ncbi:pickpocket protein 28 [Culex quinquefasciatus]|uniref:pickpocket protein 28 n=1 Tax=Culex quinquefasciatus TaxID=7176 RepID=UPI0018E2FF01|nr:pickpocket protein 28 [Culex quinquefasciatus]
MFASKVKNTLEILWREYCFKTSLHGVGFLKLQATSRYEKVMWSLWILLSLAGCVYMTYVGYHKWENNSVVITYATRSLHVWQIPFPAVTICPVTKSRREAFDFEGTYDELKRGGELRDDDSYVMFRAMLHVCVSTVNIFNFTGLYKENIVATLRNISFPLEDMFEKCSWRGVAIDCGEIFSEIVTDEGVCYNFNILTAKDLLRVENLDPTYDSVDSSRNSSLWSNEEEYTRYSGSGVYPRRALGAGVKAGLSVVLKTRKSDVEHVCRGGMDGFKVLLHSPDEFPMVSEFYMRLPLGKSAAMFLKPLLTKVVGSLESESFERRQCFFNSDRKLRFFKVYNQNNCHVECITNYTFGKCGCIKFSMPHAPDMETCNSSQIACYQHGLVAINERSIRLQLQGASTYRVCNCLPACYELVYNKEISYTPYNAEAQAISKNDSSNDISNFYHSQLLIAMKTDRTLPLTRCRLNSISDVLANLGGIFGLFIGGTTISLAEIVYFCCIRSVRVAFTQHRLHPATPKVFPWVP